MDKHLSVAESVSLTVFSIRQNGLWPLNNRKKVSFLILKAWGSLLPIQYVLEPRSVQTLRDDPVTGPEKIGIGLKISSAGMHMRLCLQKKLNTGS